MAWLRRKSHPKHIKKELEIGSFFAESLDASGQLIVFGKKVLAADLQVQQRYVSSECTRVK